MKIVFATVLAVFLLTGFSSCKFKMASQTEIVTALIKSRDWKGAYKGLLPGAGGEGIKVQITLNTDKTYQVSYQYMDRDHDLFTSSGKFDMDKNGIITIDNGTFSIYYVIGENTLTQLDAEKKPITGELADKYVLKKQHDAAKICDLPSQEQGQCKREKECVLK